MTTDPGKPDKSLDEELVLMLRYLRLGRLLTHWEEYLAAAREGRHSADSVSRCRPS